MLHGVPGSVLWLLSAPGRGDERLRDAARAVGVDPARLVFMTKQPHADYLARLRHADLFLDSTPYNAHTTASDALWAGCPVLTVPGATFAARVAGSLNHHLGLDEMNATDSAQYIALAIALGSDPERLRALRARLAALRTTSGLFDMDAFALDFSALVLRMVERHRQGLSPAPLASAASGLMSRSNSAGVVQLPLVVSRESGQPSVMLANGLKSLGPRLRGDDGQEVALSRLA